MPGKCSSITEWPSPLNSSVDRLAWYSPITLRVVLTITGRWITRGGNWLALKNKWQVLFFSKKSLVVEWTPRKRAAERKQWCPLLSGHSATQLWQFWAALFLWSSSIIGIWWTVCGHVCVCCVTDVPEDILVYEVYFHYCNRHVPTKSD